MWGKQFIGTIKVVLWWETAAAESICDGFYFLCDFFLFLFFFLAGVRKVLSAALWWEKNDLIPVATGS